MLHPPQPTPYYGSKLNFSQCSLPPLTCANGIMITYTMRSKDIGASSVMQPYIYYRNASAAGFGKNATVVGDNFSCPRKGQCKEGAKVGDDGCKWRRMSTVGVITGQHLLEAGWNAHAIDDTPHDSPSSRNLPPFKRAWASLETRVTARCCGC